MTSVIDLTALTTAWRAQDPDRDTVAFLDDLTARAEAGDQAARMELGEAFAGPLTFGTAGLRGPLGAGPARMNRVVVTQAAAGFARWLAANGHAGGRVIIGYDARYKSADFARDTAEIFAGAGFEPLLVGEPTPTPVVAFGIRHFDCVAGIVVTASHNPPQDNGYKVYLGDGSQIVPPADGEIAAEIAEVARESIKLLPRSTDYRTLGDELGSVLADDALFRGVEGVFACSVVSSTLLSRMAAAHGKPYETTLTGFKWIGRVQGLAYGYEEAIGYCCDPSSVPDKDGITAALLVLSLTARLRAAGQTIADLLDELARTYGLHSTSQLSVRVKDLSLIADAMARLRANPPATLLGEPVTVTDLVGGTPSLPPTDAVELTGPSLHVVARPSGTEPKLKCYLEVRESPADSEDLVAARTRAGQRLAQLRAEMAAALGVED